MNLLRTGVVGVGHMGVNHARVYRELESCSLSAVFDRNQDVAQRPEEQRRDGGKPRLGGDQGHAPDRRHQDEQEVVRGHARLAVDNSGDRDSARQQFSKRDQVDRSFL